MQLSLLTLALTKIYPKGQFTSSNLDLDFTSGNDTLDSRITFSRASNATVVGKDGTIQYAPHNLLTYSEQFDNAAWLKSNATVTANVISAPDGSTTADKIEATDSAPTSLFQSLAFTGSACTGSVYVKKGSGENDANRFYIRDNTTATTLLAVAIDYDTRAITYVTGTTGADVVDVGNGWLRVTLSVASGLVSGNILRFGVCFIGNNETAGEFAYAWGAQLNVGALQPYYPTTVKNLLGFTQEFDNAAWTKSNSFVQTNLLTWSEQFDNAAWGKNAITISANTIAAPDGMLTADKIQETAVTNYFAVNANPSGSYSTTYTYSIYAKAGERTAMQVSFTVSPATVIFNLANGTVASTTGSSLVNASMEAVGNGWYRCKTTLTTVASGSNLLYHIVGTAVGTSTTFAGVTGNGLYIWGAQLVQGSTPGDYQRTEGTAKAVMYQAPDGTLSADKLVEDTASNTHLIQQTPTFQSGTVYCHSVYAKAAERTVLQLRTTSGSTFSASFDLLTGTVSQATAGTVASMIAIGNGWYRCAIVFTAGASGAFACRTAVMQNVISQSYTGDGTSGIYIWGAQLSDSASLDPYVYNPGAAPTAAAYYGPRFDYDPVTLQPKGLLIEEQRTNSIRNNTMVGAVAGTPGTLPTNWGVLALASGLSSEIVSVSTSNGIAYIDYKISGTTSNASSLNLVFDSNTAIAAASGQTWTGSSYIAIVGGNFTNISSASLRVTERTGAGGFVGATETSIATATNSLIANKFIATRTLGATAGAVQLGVFLSIASGVNVDCTLRIGMPQLEQGSFASSVIPTSGAQATRAADVATMTGTNFSSWYNQTEGTLFAEATSSLATGYIWTLMRAGVGYGPRIQNTLNGSNVSYGAVVDNAGAVVVSFTRSGLKSAFALKTDDYALSANGGAVITDNSGTIPTEIAQLRLGIDSVGGTALNGHIRRIAYWPRRLSDAELQGITS